MTAALQSESLRWSVCPSEFEDLRHPRYFKTRDESVDFLKSGAEHGWGTPLPVLSVLEYPNEGASPRFHLNASAFPINVTAAPRLALVENPPEWAAAEFQSYGLLHNTTTHHGISVSLPEDLESGEAIEYGKDLEAEIVLAIALPDCCLSRDSFADEVERIALQFPGNDLTRKRARLAGCAGRHYDQMWS